MEGGGGAIEIAYGRQIFKSASGEVVLSFGGPRKRYSAGPRHVPPPASSVAELAPGPMMVWALGKIVRKNRPELPVPARSDTSCHAVTVRTQTLQKLRHS
ncbi:hypothetical protein J6590_018632 [Homalodisca vitripennis]|nr:hypothetical protein J6590_018632 [Homalodisca vitripennis]